jgi:hypothetical protein
MPKSVNAFTQCRCYPLAESGSNRLRTPVTANNALASAGATGGNPGSPSPPHVQGLSRVISSSRQSQHLVDGPLIVGVLVGPLLCFKVELSPRAPTRLQAGPPGAALEALPASGPDRLDYSWGALEAWLDGVDRLSVESTFLWPSAHERLAIWRRAMGSRCVQRNR